jgi:hypothetical protein
MAAVLGSSSWAAARVVDEVGVNGRKDGPCWAKYKEDAKRFGLTEGFAAYSTRLRVGIDKVWIRRQTMDPLRSEYKDRIEKGEVIPIWSIKTPPSAFDEYVWDLYWRSHSTTENVREPQVLATPKGHNPFIIRTAPHSATRPTHHTDASTSGAPVGEGGDEASQYKTIHGAQHESSCRIAASACQNPRKALNARPRSRHATSRR